MGFKSDKQRKKVMALITNKGEDYQRDIYLEVEEDAWNEGRNRRGAMKLVKNEKWLDDEAHDMALRYNLNQENLRQFLKKKFDA